MYWINGIFYRKKHNKGEKETFYTQFFLNFLNFFKKTLDLMILIMYNKIVLRERA